MTDYSIFSRSEYFSELVRKVDDAQPGSRVALATMNLQPWNPGVNKILESLNKAAGRGVSVSLIVDAYTFMAADDMTKPGPLFWRATLPKRLSKNHNLKLNALEELKSAGGNYAIANQPSRRLTPPFKGRSHIKFAIINDYVFAGNCNLDKEDQIDLMVGWRDVKAANWLYGFAEKIIKTGSIRQAVGSNKDRELSLSSDSRLLLDVGKPNQSLIFKEALSLIDKAQKTIVFVCQYFPDKTVLDHLAAAHNRGVDVRLIYNHPLNRVPVLATAHSLNKAKNRLTRPSVLFKYQLPRRSTYLHAKLLAADQAVMVGSHNFVEAGVKYGTAELAIISTDQALANKLVEVLNESVSTKKTK